MGISVYYANFNDSDNIRNKPWLTGPQYWQDGSSIMFATINIGHNQLYTGPNPTAAYIYTPNLTPLTDNSSRLRANSFTVKGSPDCHGIQL